MSATSERMAMALNKLTKWRSIFAGWQLGTRFDGDPECAAVRDHHESTIVLRVETTAIMSLLIRRGIISEDDYMNAVTEEAALLDADLEQKFPGFKSTPGGMVADVKVAAETTKHWRK